MNQVIAPFPRTEVLVRDQPERFPVRRVYCVGRNYAEHAQEMGHDPVHEEPFFFSKPSDAIVSCAYMDVTPLAYPPETADLQHEVELVVAIGSTGQGIREDEALSIVWGYGVGIDLTRRDLQRPAKRSGRPWDLAKGFDQSAPVSELVPASVIGHPAAGAITLGVNGRPRQSGNIADQIWGVPSLISILSRSVVLQPGDLIFTGTPAGVAPLQRGDVVSAEIEGVSGLTCRIE